MSLSVLASTHPSVARRGSFTESLHLQGGLSAVRVSARERRSQADAIANRARYGPRSAPLFYTALRSAPTRLVWEAIPGVLSYRVTVERLDAEAPSTPLLALTLPE